MKSIFCKWFFILQLIFHFCGCKAPAKTPSKYFNIVCLYNIDCNLPLDTEFNLNHFYIAFNDKCNLVRTPLMVKIANKNFRFLARWKPENQNKYRDKVYFCGTFVRDRYYVYYVRRVLLLKFGYYYSIDDNNNLNFVLSDCKENEVDLLISRGGLYFPDEHHPEYHFVKLNDKLVSSAPVNTIKKETEISEIYVYIYLKNLTDALTFITKLYILDHDKITGFEHKVVENHIVAEIKGIDLKLEKTQHIKQVGNLRTEYEIPDGKYSGDQIESNFEKFEKIEPQSKINVEKEYIKFYLSAQSTEDKNGDPSKCGSPDTLWHVLNLSYTTTSETEKSVIILLPLELYGRKIKICASTIDGKQEDYKIPIYTLEANDISSGYYKEIFYSSPLGMTEITLKSDLHPLSEIKLVDPCHLNTEDPIYKSFKNLEACKKPTEHFLGYQQIDQEYTSNLSYRKDDLYLSLYNQNTIPNYVLPHILYYLPDKAIRSKSETIWSIKNLFLPKLHSEPTYPYLIFACNKWEHIFCFRDDEFDTPVGIIYPSPNFVFKISARWSQDKMILELTTLAQNAPVLKLVMSRDLQYANYDSKCNNVTGFYSSDPVLIVNENEPNKTYQYSFTNLAPGKIYFMCVLREETPKNQSLKLIELYTKQEGQHNQLKNPLKKYIRSTLYWEFLGIINTNSAMAGNRITFNKMGDNENLLFPTTGLKNTYNISGMYFTKDLAFDCSSLNPFGSITTPAPKYNYSSLITFVQNKYTNTKKTLSSDSYDDPSLGFWLSLWPGNWKPFRKYISYTGPFNPTGKIYRICNCSNGECYPTGNAVYSRMESFQLSQFIKFNDIYDKIILGRYMCLYNNRTVSCFDGEGNFSDYIKKEVDLVLPQIQINNVSFHHSSNLLILLSPSNVYIYETDLKYTIKIEEIFNMKSIFSFPKVSFVLSSDSIYAYLNESIFNNIEENREKIQFVEGNKSIDNFIKIESEEDNLIIIDFELTPYMENIQIYPIDENSFYCFIIYNKLEMDYYKIELDYEEKTNKMELKYKLSLKEYFPGVNNGIVLKTKSLPLFGKDIILFFFSHYEYEQIKVFYFETNNEEEEIKFHSNVDVTTGIIDFITTKTHIICLVSKIYQDELTQYISQLEFGNLLEVTFKYPELHDIVYGEDYLFEPELSSGLVLRYYLDGIEEENEQDEQKNKLENYPLGESGFSLNTSTGVISGTSRFIGKYETTIYLDVFLGKTSVTISFISRCPLGEQQDEDGKICEKCPKGFYRNKISLDKCESCDEYILNTTTETEGTVTPRSCSCKPGYYNSNFTCIECPPGTFSEKLGSFACEGKCPENMISQVTGASSLQQLNCTCIPGYYFENDKCIKCPIGNYCPGNNQVIKCPENKYTITEGISSEEGCLCKEGYELLDQNCRPCNRYSYKPNTGNEKCTLCPSENSDEFQSHTSKLGSTSKADCKFCEPGHYFNSGVCRQCPSGFFCKGEDFQPVKCGKDTIVLNENGIDSNYCLCPKGFGFPNFLSKTDISIDCVKCPINTFQPIEGTINGCISCPKNTYTLKDGSTSLLDCIPKQGYYNISQNNYNLLVGNLESNSQLYYKNVVNSMGTECIKTNEPPPEPSIITDTNDLSSCIRLCKLNPYCKYVHYSESNEPTNSISNTGLDSELEVEGKKLFRICRMYTSYNSKIPYRKEVTLIANPEEYEGPILCEVLRMYAHPIFISCPRNHYCPGGFNSQKIKCPANSVTLNQGSVSPGECLCLPGYYLYDETCVPCKIGFYKPTISNSRCTECPQNTTTFGEGSFIIKQCGCNKRMYAVSKKQNVDIHKKMVYLGDNSDESTESSDEDNINYLIEQNIKMLTDSELDFYCYNCLYGYFCKGSWIFKHVHMPPIPCFNGSSVPHLSSIQSINSCLCNPGYGLMNRNPNFELGYGLACEKCLPGRYKSVFDNSPCHEACPVHSTSLPGSTSGKECFCIPGFYMIYEKGKLSCKKCKKGAMSYGGVDNGIHTRPIPKKGFSIINIPKNNDLDEKSFLQTIDDNPLIYENDPTDYIYPCLNPDRCIGGGVCSEGSTGFLCSECGEGYDVLYFNSSCSKCSKDLIKMVYSRIVLYSILISIGLYNSSYNRSSELSLVPIFKILYMFTLSLVPLGILPINSSSSLRKFHLLYKWFLFSPLNFYSSVDRINCFKKSPSKILVILNKLRLDILLFNKAELGYLEVWYLQRYIGIFKIVLDVLIITILNIVLYLISKLTLFKEWKLRKKLDKLSEKIEITESSLSSIHTEYEFKDKDKRLTDMLIQQIVLMICLHIPSISLNSLAMVWCTKFSSHETMVLLHQPTQICSFNNHYFLMGAITSIISMILVVTTITFMFFRLIKTKYSTDWRNIFITGYKPKFRNWDSIQLIRQVLIICLIVCQKSMEASDSELNRLLNYMMLQIFYLVLLLSLEPYDSRSGSFFIKLEKLLIHGSLLITFFIYGSHFYNIENFGGFPFILASFSYLRIIFTFITESISIHNIRSKSKRGFSSTVIKFFLLTFKYNNSSLFFNSKDDTLVFESYGMNSKNKKFSIRRPLILKHNKLFLTTCFQDLSQQCVEFKKKGGFSKEFYYFYIRLIFWHSRCLKINIFDKKIGDLDYFHYLAYLYYFDSRLKDKSASIIFQYPINNLKTHIIYYHGSDNCYDGCSTYVSSTSDESISEVMACLLVDCLFDRIYETDISLVEFYYSLLTIGHISNTDMKIIFSFYKTHLSYIRNREKYRYKFKIDSLSSEISTLKRTTMRETKSGELRIKEIELLEDRDKLKDEIQKLTESVNYKRKSVDDAKKQYSRASALKFGVEELLSGNLTNEQIINSISSLNDKIDFINKSRITLNKKSQRDTVYKLKVT